jgi:transposase
MKVLAYDGFGMWLAARRLNKGHFVWANAHSENAEISNPEQLRALVIELPWQTLAHDHVISVCSKSRKQFRFLSLPTLANLGA